jgi:hypothetical protein
MPKDLGICTHALARMQIRTGEGQKNLPQAGKAL